MDFVANKQPQIEEMLKTIGIKNVEELFSSIPESLRLPAPTTDDGLSEYEGIRLMEALSLKNTFALYDNYLGAGSYEHHIPALVEAVCSKSEFLTAYTPYQAEASQGMLQTMFEFQSAICAMTGLDAANASVYDGASACAEAVLMALRTNKKRNKILIAHSIHPNYRGVVDQYLNTHDVVIETIPFQPNGSLDTEQALSLIDEETAVLLVQSPNFFGVIENLASIFEKAKSVDALSILSANPLSYGLYASAAEQGADIAVGDCQPFGIPMQFGGPYAGYMACRQKLVRQLPGRIVGETVDLEGKRGFVLTLQAREQHIRREKATSNICTNQALSALASLVAMLWYGKEGVQKLALTNYQRAAYLKDKLSALPHVEVFKVPFLNEFVAKFSHPIELVQQQFRDCGIEPGLPLGDFYPEFQNHLLIAVTETKNLLALDLYCNVVRQLGDFE